MKYITPRKLVLAALLLPVMVMAGVFLPATPSLRYDEAQQAAGEKFTKILWSYNLTTKTRDWEGRQYFDDGVKAFEDGLSFKQTYRERLANCLARSKVGYCEAASEAFSSGYSFAESSTDQETARKAVFKVAQEDNWQTDVKNGKLPSYLIRQ